MLEARNIARMRGDRLLFRDLSLHVAAGEVLRVAGPNGSGKTSLLRVLSGLVAPDAGEVLWQGQRIAAEPETFQRQLLYVGHAFAIHDLLTPLENLYFACASAGHSRAQVRQACHDALVRIGLRRQMDLPARVLSQGQRRRIALARLFVERQRPLWILDEPFSALDVGAVADLTQTLRGHCASGGMVVVITHQEVGLEPQPRVLSLGEAVVGAC